MRFLILACLLLSACAKGPNEQSQAPAPAPEPKVYDACTYSAGFIPEPVFICVESTYLASEHPELAASLFAGADRLITREDFHQQQSYCGPFHMACMVLVQGPGPLAL